MSVTYELDGDALTRVRSKTVQLVQSAELGQVGTGRLTVNDKAGTKEIVGQKDFAVDEDACPDPITYRGFVGDREYSRGAEAQGPGREIDVELDDLNAMLGFRGIISADRKRPRETVADRGAWLLGSGYVTGLFVDNGRCDFTDERFMDKADYTDQFPGDVLADMALAQGGVNYYIRDFGDGPELVFRDDNASTADTSTLHISNRLADIDDDDPATQTVFPPSKDFSLRRRPGRVKSKLAYQYATGRVVRSRPETAAAFNGERFGVASNSNVKKRNRARERADDQLWQLHTEEDVLEGRIIVPASHANLLNHGDRVGVRLEHMAPEGYFSSSGWKWCRVLELTKRPMLRPVGKYELEMRLSPQEPACSVEPELVQWTYADAEDVGEPGIDRIRFSLDDPSTLGNLLVLGWLYDSDQMIDPERPDGWSYALDNFEMQNGTLFNCVVYWKQSQGEDHVDIDFFDITLSGGRGIFMEWEGLTNPSLYAAATTLRQTGLGYASVPATSYPAGALALIDFAFMRTGPEDPDLVIASGTGHSLHVPWDVDWDMTLVNAGIAVGGMTRGRDDTAGTTPLYPAAGGWRFLNTNDEPTVTVGLVFSGEC